MLSAYALVCENVCESPLIPIVCLFSFSYWTHAQYKCFKQTCLWLLRMHCLSLSGDNYFLWNSEEYNTHCDTQSLLCPSKIAWSMKLQPHTVWPPQHLHLSSIRREWQHIPTAWILQCHQKYLSLSFHPLSLPLSLSLSLLIDTRSLLLQTEKERGRPFVFVFLNSKIENRYHCYDMLSA